jgi:hypothetical protein
VSAHSSFPRRYRFVAIGRSSPLYRAVKFLATTSAA